MDLSRLSSTPRILEHKVLESKSTTPKDHLSKDNSRDDMKDKNAPITSIQISNSAHDAGAFSFAEFDDVNDKFSLKAEVGVSQDDEFYRRTLPNTVW